MENPFEEQSTKMTFGKFTLTYGAVLGVIMVIISLVFYIINIDPSSFIQYLNIAVIIAFLTYSILQYRNTVKGGYISYGQSLGCGVMVGIYATAISSLYTFVFFQFIDPGMITEMLAKSEERMLEQNPNLSQEQIDMGMKYAAMFMKPWLMAIMGFLTMSFMSLILSLIISIFTQKPDKSKIVSEIR